MDLKPYFDRAKADSAEVIRLKNELDTSFNLGTDEGIQAAIDLQPQLEAAIVKADQSNGLYISMRNADNAASNAASLFVAETNEQDEEGGSKIMNRTAFIALTPAKREDYLKQGGKIQD
jgi:aspartate aminotransferase-like enzyme